jgi:soluble lytic murein transglycosylase
VYIARDVDPKNISIDDPKLIKAIIKVESNGDRFAKSNKGAYGLMQVRYEVWKKDLANIGILSHWGLYDPSKNVEAGKYILAQHHKQAKGNLRKTLQDYSGGASGYYEKVMYHYLTHKEE